MDKEKKRGKSLRQFVMKNRLWIVLGVVIIALLIAGLTIPQNEQNRSSEQVSTAKNSSGTAGKEPDSDQSENGEVKESEESINQGDTPQTKLDDIYVAPAFFESDFDLDDAIDIEDTKYIQFPYKVPGTSLVLTGLKIYDGVFIEDGSNKDVANIPALFVENQGEEDVEYANIRLIGETCTYDFSVTGLEAGTVVAAQEANAQTYTDQNYVSADTVVSDPAPFEKNESVEVIENEDGSLTVTNIGDTEIPAVRIFYKYYYPEQNAYLGGISFTAKIPDLEAGESRTITPSHYQKDSSKITMIRTYTESD